MPPPPPPPPVPWQPLHCMSIFLDRAAYVSILNVGFRVFHSKRDRRLETAECANEQG